MDTNAHQAGFASRTIRRLIFRVSASVLFGARTTLHQQIRNPAEKQALARIALKSLAHTMHATAAWCNHRHIRIENFNTMGA